MRQKQMQEMEEAKKIKVPSKLLKDFQKEIKNERDYQFAGTDSKEDRQKHAYMQIHQQQPKLQSA